MMSEERRQREADEERKTYEYETLQKNFDEIIGKYNNLRTRTGLIQVQLSFICHITFHWRQLVFCTSYRESHGLLWFISQGFLAQ